MAHRLYPFPVRSYWPIVLLDCAQDISPHELADCRIPVQTSPASVTFLLVTACLVRKVIAKVRFIPPPRARPADLGSMWSK